MSSDSLLIEVSWETANMVGGIHTVLATKAAAMRGYYPRGYVAIGPDLWKDSPDPPAFAREDIFPGFEAVVQKTGLSVRQGRWLIPGKPACLLVDFSDFYSRKDELLSWLWETSKVDSLLGGWDYVEPALFGLASGVVIERLITEQLDPGSYDGVVAQFHEWLVGAGILHLTHEVPAVGTVFTTHATVLGRALSGEGDALQSLLADPPRDLAAVARQRGVTAKHSLESVAAQKADCFTTVSETTAAEAATLLGRAPDIVTPNGLGDDYPPPAFGAPEARAKTRARLLKMAGDCLVRDLDPARTTLALSSGRMEFTNKGIDLVIDTVAALRDDAQNGGLPGGELVLILAFPGDHTGPNRQLLAAARRGQRPPAPIRVTHDLADPDGNPILRRLAEKGLGNGVSADGPVHVLYVPIYLDGRDPLLPMPYFQMLPAFDLTLFPSHYEPWGYTPMESIGYGVPTITSDMAGFGRWAAGRGGWAKTGVHVLRRSEMSYDEAIAQLTDVVRGYLRLDAPSRAKLGEAARELAAACNWGRFAARYHDAHQQALARSHERVRKSQRRGTRQLFRSLTVRGSDIQAPRLRHVTVVGALPEQLGRLREIAYNLFWTWDDAAASLFRDLAPIDQAPSTPLNPLAILDGVDPARARGAIEDAGYMARYHAACERLDALRAEAKEPQIGYFCAEFGLTGCLPLYAGGMGVLAGDHLKSASDLGLPLVGVGLAYRHGYFKQRIDADGVQHADVVRNDFTSQPMVPVTGEDGQRLVVSVGLPGRSVDIAAWRVDVGRVRLYLLDTDLPSNAAADRAITDALYGGGTERRLQQEIVLALGGYRLLGALGLPIDVYHMNEGHSAFLVLARAKHLVQRRNLKFDEALEYIRQTTLFTTHTPVPAGHDAFDEALMRPYFSHYADYLHISWEALLALGHWPAGDPGQPFSMTLLALHGAARVNGVSKIHGEISRQMFHGLFPGFQTGEVPVGHITNGVHPGTWLAPALGELLEGALGADWYARLAEGGELDIDTVDGGALWAVHQHHKALLLDELRRRLEARWAAERRPPAELDRRRALLTDDALIVTFARRFAPYKRAKLLFEDLPRLKRVIAEAGRPVIFLFAGKAHPADTLGQQLIRDICELAEEPGLAGHVMVLENYDLALAEHLVRGSDVWLNNPTRPLEASGTSGMKAAMNGVLNLSVQDGWWAEGYSGDNGWSIGGDYDPEMHELDNAQDHAQLLDLLQHEVLPLFGQREDGVPSQWVWHMRRSIATCLAEFASSRMVAQYAANYYWPMLERAPGLAADDFAPIHARVERRRRIDKAWSDLRVQRADIGGLAEDELPVGTPVELKIELSHPGLTADDLLVQILHGRPDDKGELVQPTIMPLDAAGGDDGKTAWHGTFVPDRSGALAVGIRVVPRQADSGADAPDSDMALKRVRWL